MVEDVSYVHRYGPRSLVEQVTFTGLERTKIETVLREFEGFDQINSIEGVYQALEEVHNALMSLDAFEAVDIVIDEGSQVSCFSLTGDLLSPILTSRCFQSRMMQKLPY